MRKQVGQEMLENEEVKDYFISPFKSQGATLVDDYGFVITTKFMCKPGRQFVIRRYAFAAVQKAFEANGIAFATPRVDVSVEEVAPRDAGERERDADVRSSAAGAAVERIVSSSSRSP